MEKPAKSSGTKSRRGKKRKGSIHTESDNQYYRRLGNAEELCEKLDLDTFKVTKCSQKAPHCYRKCFYYHNETDRRRDVQKYHYTPEFCPYIESQGYCKFKDSCSKSHSKAEQGYHPEKYRQKFCACYPDNLEECPYGQFCSYAHSELEIQTTLIHNYKRDEDFYLFQLKTKFCPYSCAHDRGRCIYAHNWQDYRRDPSVYWYAAVLCKNWDRTKKISNYEKGCPKGYKCQECHGWKELDFHPSMFRTKFCQNTSCNGEEDICSNFHNEADARNPSSPTPGFVYGPANRTSKQKLLALKEDEQHIITRNNQSRKGNTSQKSSNPAKREPYTVTSYSSLNEQRGPQAPKQDCFIDMQSSSQSLRETQVMNTSSNRPNKQISSPFVIREDFADEIDSPVGKAHPMRVYEDLINGELSQSMGESAISSKDSKEKNADYDYGENQVDNSERLVESYLQQFNQGSARDLETANTNQKYGDTYNDTNGPISNFYYQYDISDRPSNMRAPQQFQNQYGWSGYPSGQGQRPRPNNM